MDVYGSNKCLAKQAKAKKQTALSTDNLAQYENLNEDETVSNAYLISEFNENTFHISLNDKDFRYEQFEQTVKTITNVS